MSGTLDSLLEESAQRRPGKAALATASESFTYAQLRERVLRAAAAFRARGVKKGDSLALVLRNGPDFVTAYFALARLGAVAAPINFLVTKAEELRFMLADCGAVGVVTQPEFLKGLLAARKDLPGLRWLWSAGGEGAAPGGEGATPGGGGAAPGGGGDEAEPLGPFFAAGEPATLPPCPAAPGDVAAILYTSGTTGEPKGVMLTHANLVSNADGAIRAVGVDEREVILCILPMFHTFAWTANVVAPLRLGAKIVIAPSVAPAEPWLKLMARHGVTMFSAVPALYAVLAARLGGRDLKSRLRALVMRHYFFRRVRLCISGAAPLGLETAETFERVLGIPISEGYGLTETSPVATINAPGRPRRGSVGTPLPDVRLKIVDDEENPLPVGAEGEVCIQGPNIMLGYHRRPQETREAFTKDGWLRTGDVGALDADGYLYIRDRKKDMIIVKGLKVFPAQLERTIAQHPDVAEVAVIGIPERAGDETIKAFIILRPGAGAGKAALLKFCREKLDPYKRPRDIEIVEALPKNALQKVLKRVLRQQEIEKRSGS